MKTLGIPAFDLSKVPFVPALDLLEKENNKLSAEEASVLALSLYLSLGERSITGNAKWAKNAKTDALEQRL